MVGRKRAAEESPTEKRETRSAKVPKTESRKSTKGTGRKGGSKLKTSMGAATFKSRAESLYVNLTHTVPSADVEASEKDPGFMAAIELVTTSFSTGSFGWKGNKRMTVTLPQREGEEEAEKLHISLSINATVIGSKDAKDEGEEGEEGEKAGEQAGEKEAEGEDEPAQEGAPPAPAEEAEGTEKVSS